MVQLNLALSLPLGKDLVGLVIRLLHTLLLPLEILQLKNSSVSRTRTNNTYSVQASLIAPKWANGSLLLAFTVFLFLPLPWSLSLCIEISRLLDHELSDWILFGFKFQAPARVWHMLDIQ